MFGVGFSELILILVIVYIFVGPEDLPKVARWLGRAIKRIHMLILELRRDTGIDEVIQETKTLRRDLDSAVRDNDITRNLHEVRDELSGLGRDITQDINDTKAEISSIGREISRDINDAKADTFRPSQPQSSQTEESKL